MQCTKPPQGWSCTRPEGHSGPCAASQLPAQSTFKGTELERDVIQAAIAWYEEQQENAEPEHYTRAQAALSNAVLALGSQEGGF